MSERKYTLKEIQELRHWIEGEWSRERRTFMAADLEVGVEERLRTYMAAGITAQDFIDEINREAARAYETSGGRNDREQR